MNIKFSKGWIKKTLLHKLKNYVTVLIVLKNPKNLKNTSVDVQVKLWLKNGCLQLNIYTSKLLRLSVKTMNSNVEHIIDLLQDKSSLSSPYRSIFVISSSCFFKMLSSIFLILVKRDCLAHWKRGQWRRKWVVVSISRPQTHIGLIQSWKLCLNLW